MNIDKTVKNLQKNNMQVFVLDSKEEALLKIINIMDRHGTIGFGGSVTLDECGVKNYLSSNFKVLDEGSAQSADTYLCSSNAITEDGELYNVDGRSNRVACIAYGPKSVIIVAGKNKIVKDIEAANKRVKKIAAPKNCVRLKKDTYCAVNGKCQALAKEETGFTSGCDSADRICCNYLVSGRQKIKDRVKVILIKEDLGY